MPHHMRRSWCAQGGDGACSRRAESLRGTCSARAQTRCTGRAMAQCAPCRAVGVVVSSNTILKMTTTIPRARMKVAEIAESRNPAARSRSAPRAAVASGVCRDRGITSGPLRPAHTATASSAWMARRMARCASVSRAVCSGPSRPSGPGSRGTRLTSPCAACSVPTAPGRARAELLLRDEHGACEAGREPVESRQKDVPAHEKIAQVSANHVCTGAAW